MQEKRIHNLTYTLMTIQLALCDIEGNIRISVDEDEIRRLGESLRKRQIHPIFVLVTAEGRYLVVDGGKRVRAARAVGLTELLAVVSQEPMTREQTVELQLISAFHRSDPTGYDQWQAMEAVKAAHADWSQKQLAELLDIDAKMVRVLLSPGQVIEGARESLRLGKIGISDCHVLAMHDAQEQQALLDRRLSGVSRDGLAAESRKRRNGHAGAQASKTEKITIALSSGTVIRITGDAMTIDDAIGELTNALAKLKKAEKDGLDVKTFQAVCRDQAKAMA